jgi:hypothetical protein
MGMLAAVRRMLAHQMTIAEWIGTGVLLAVPAAILLALVSWLVLTIPAVCAR